MTKKYVSPNGQVENDHSGFNEKMKFSIVVPAHKDDKHIDECIKSIFKQGLEPKDYEVLVTTDNIENFHKVFDIALNYILSHPEIRINVQNGQLHSEAVRGLAGEYVVLLDGHDHLSDECLKNEGNQIFSQKPREREDKYVLKGARRPIVSRQLLLQNPDMVKLIDRVTGGVVKSNCD